MIKSSKKPIAIIVAVDEQNGIGRDGGLLCHLPADLKHFRETTTGQCVIMGRNTFESLPKGALPHRTNIVITSDMRDNYPNCIVARSVDEALNLCDNDRMPFIIGGAKLYESTLPIADKLYLTRIHHTFLEADTFFPEIDSSKWTLVENMDCRADDKNKYDYSFSIYVKNNFVK